MTVPANYGTEYSVLSTQKAWHALFCIRFRKCLCFTSLQQRSHLETAPHVLSLAKDVELGILSLLTLIYCIFDYKLENICL